MGGVAFSFLLKCFIHYGGCLFVQRLFPRRIVFLMVKSSLLQRFKGKNAFVTVSETQEIENWSQILLLLYRWVAGGSCPAARASGRTCHFQSIYHPLVKSNLMLCVGFQSVHHTITNPQTKPTKEMKKTKRRASTGSTPPSKRVKSTRNFARKDKHKTMAGQDQGEGISL